MEWLAVGFVAFVGIGMLLWRRQLARLQALVLGGSILPGCVVAQGATLVVIALVIAVLRLRGFF
jgi:hypothetical protein